MSFPTIIGDSDELTSREICSLKAAYCQELITTSDNLGLQDRIFRLALISRMGRLKNPEDDSWAEIYDLVDKFLSSTVSDYNPDVSLKRS